MMYQAQVPLGGLPIHLVLVGNRGEGKVVFVPINRVGVVMDYQVRDKVSAWFDGDGFTMYDQESSEDFRYETVYDYKNIPLMLKWLQQQNLQQPQ